MIVETEPFISPEGTSYEFSEFEKRVVQGLINGWDYQTFRENDIRICQIDDAKKKLSKEFGGSPAIGGFFLAIREMVRQAMQEEGIVELNLDALPSRLAAEPNDRDLLIWASMYNGLSPLKTRQLLGEDRLGKLAQLRNSLVRTLGFKNHYQAVAWWEREKMRLGVQGPMVLCPEN